MRTDSYVVVLLARLHAEAADGIVIERPPDGPVVIREAAFGAIAAVVGGPRQVDVKRHGNGDDEGADSQDAPPGGAEEESGSDGAEQPAGHDRARERDRERSEEHTSELQSLMRISYAVFCLKKKQNKTPKNLTH